MHDLHFRYEVLSAVEMMKDSQTSFSINTSLSSVGKVGLIMFNESFSELGE